ncbi:MAG TPA: adenylate/guanylate cyclase domain-containing protein, partial [Mariprofundaceae bacterium]|nr:adenylate/guanylate cyclase domain-containing protein [Mariprofundaceae bacterium]
TAEVDVIVSSFLKKVPAVLGVHVQYVNGKNQQYGKITPEDNDRLSVVPKGQQVSRIDSKQLWYVKRIEYSGTVIGSVAVRYSQKAWDELAEKLVWRMILAAVAVVVLAGIGAYWIAGRMSSPMENFARGAQHVAQGDYNIRLPVIGNDEISDAATQFNHMVAELAHKEEMRNVFGRYLNPKLVEEVFDGGMQTINKRQEVTVLFADMVSFTAFSESTATEEVVDVLNQHFEVFHRIIDYYGGHVDKYIGDAVMAVFNHPWEDTKHSQHAAMAALAMTEACKRLGILRKSGEPIAFRVGINSGQVIVGSIGAAERLEYTVIGDAVNIASRMASLGEGNEVVLPRATFTKLGAGFDFNAIGERDIKGVSDPMECGKLQPKGEESLRNIKHAVALAFDLTLPSGMRQIVGDVEHD